MKKILHQLFVAMFCTFSAFGVAHACTSNEFDVNGTCVENKFSITTTNLSADTTFKFQMSAAGVFYVDWGDGNKQTIDRTGNTTETQYTHTYSSAGSYIIKFGGLATEYSSLSMRAAIRFGGSSEDDYTPDLISSISGSIGAIFPTLNNGSNNLSYQPQFNYTFSETNVTSLPDELFDGVFGAASYMFINTFIRCRSLTSIPAGLFKGVRGAGFYMFGSTFHFCSQLVSIPSGLFSGVYGVANNMFYDVFYGCTNLVSVPYNLFSGLYGTAENGMFYQAFYNNTSLSRFVYPDGSYVNYIPAQFFGNISGGTGVMTNVFAGNTAIASSCPTGTTQNVTGYESEWNGRVSCEPSTITINWGNGNGGIHETNTCTYGGDITTPVSAPTKRGYRFIGWVFD